MHKPSTGTMRHGERIWRELRIKREAARQKALPFIPCGESGGYCAELELPRGTLVVRVDDLGRYGAMLRELELLWDRPQAGGRDFDALVEDLMGAASEIIEKFSVIESEPVLTRALLRSRLPAVGLEGFYEMILEGGRGVTLRYYRVQGGERRWEAANIGAEALRRLVDSLARLLE